MESGRVAAARQGSVESMPVTGSTSTDAASLQETWVVMELCDKGTLQRALRDGLLHQNGHVMMVRRR